MKKALLFLSIMLILSSCSKKNTDNPDTSANTEIEKGVLGTLANTLAGKWKTIQIPGAVCSNGSPYKIFVQKADSLSDLIAGNNKRLSIYLEGGGACWDYQSCTGQSGIRGAANPNGIPDNYMDLGAKIDGKGGSVNPVYSPYILPNHPSGRNIKASSWNKVFIPYCTGDVFSGNRVTVYEDPAGKNSPVTYRHFGHLNLEKVIAYLKTQFNNPEEMFVTGFSAGGAGSLINYHFFRKALNPKKGYMVNDSGPIFSAPDESYYQYRLHQKIKEVWNADYLVSKYIADFPELNFNGDLGLINEAIARAYPQDKLSIAVFVRDGNYSGYSYARFYGLDENIPEQKEQVLQMWHADLKNLMKTYDKYPNMKYFIPYFRDINESHCVSIIEFKGTEIYSTGADLGTFTNNMMYGFSFKSYYEEYNANDKNVTGFWIELIKLIGF